RVTSAGHIAADTIERHDPLLDRDARGHSRLPAARHLPLRNRPDVVCRGAERGAHTWRDGLCGRLHLCPRNLRVAVEAVERPRVAEQRLVAMLADVGDDLRDTPIGLRIADALRR